jgi:hypothetical protein
LLAATAVGPQVARLRSHPKSPGFLRLLAENTVHSPAHLRSHPKTEGFSWLLKAKSFQLSAIAQAPAYT